MSSSNKHPAPSQGSGLIERLRATRRALGTGLSSLLGAHPSLDDASRDDLEALLLSSDVGWEATQTIIDSLTSRLKNHAQASTHKLLHQVLRDILAPCQQPLLIPSTIKPFVIMAVGVNGAGKTTTLGKLAHRLKSQGLQVMLAAADTFRAAAVEQLQTWGERNNVPVIAQASGADPAAVAHDAMQAAQARAMDVLIIDTAGRLHTQGGLMDELKKIKRVITRFDPQAPHEVLQILDAGNGQNALAQVQQFHAAVGISGLCLTKLDGTAKGGIVFALAKKIGLPIRFLGVGESREDLQVFDADEFVTALISTAE